MQKLKISIIGAGNVSTHLAKNLYNVGHSILQIYSRNLPNAQQLSNKVKATGIDTLALLNKDADLILLCVSDSAIEEIVSQLQFQPKLIAHTAGSVSINELKILENYGVFYPLQTFSKESELNIKTVPFCIEANTPKNRNILLDVAKSLSDTVYELNSEQRLQCHLAAVFANNFSNHMLAIAENLLAKSEIPFEILKPLILETAYKIQKISPQLAQTGPASRNDSKTMQQHLKLLSSQQLEKIYSFVSQSIWELKNQDVIKNNKTNNE